VAQVLGPGVAVDEDVVEENKDKATQERAQHLIHESLEHRRCIGQPDWHDQELVEALMHAERGLVDVLQVHEHLVIPKAEVELGEVPSAM